MSTIIVLFAFLLLQDSTFTKLVYELRGDVSGMEAFNVTLWQYYSDEGHLVLGGYEH